MRIPAIIFLLIFNEYRGLSLSIGLWAFEHTSRWRLNATPFFWLMKSVLMRAPSMMGSREQVLSEFVTIKALQNKNAWWVFFSFFLFLFLFCFVLHVAFHRTCICLIRHWSSTVWSLRSRCRYLALTPFPSSCFSCRSLCWRWAQSHEEQGSSYCTSTVTDFNHYCSHEMATKYLRLVKDQLCFCKVYFEQVAVIFFRLFRSPDWHKRI